MVAPGSDPISINSFNRTFMELKSPFVVGVALQLSVLIVPLWN